MDDSFSTVLKHIKQQAVFEFFVPKNVTPTKTDQNYWIYMVNNVALWGEKFKGQWRKFGPEHLAVVWKATSKKSMNLFKKIKEKFMQWLSCAVSA
jgi:hypothetical protein